MSEKWNKFSSCAVYSCLKKFLVAIFGEASRLHTGKIYLRPDLSKGLPFFCVAWQRDNLHSSFLAKSWLGFWSFEIKLGRIGPEPNLERVS